jgi:uncharacterized protein (TIGR02246 family)
MLRHRGMGVALALLGLAAVASAASTASASAEDVVSQAKAESEALDKAFNQHQPKAVGALCTESADYTFLQGSSLETLEFGLINGRDQIIETMETFFQLFPSAKLTHAVRRARLVTPDVMVSDEDMEITGLAADAGPIRGQVVVVRVRADGTWKIAAVRNISKVPPPKP